MIALVSSSMSDGERVSNVLSARRKLLLIRVRVQILILLQC